MKFPIALILWVLIPIRGDFPPGFFLVAVLLIDILTDD